MAEQAEFDLIKKYFTPNSWRSDVCLGVGDDCALLIPPPDLQLAVTVDTLVSGIHFPVNTSPADIAYKSIAVSLSDLAAMGARPAWATLALTLPDINDQWLQAFSDSFSKTLNNYDVQLIGGDTTQGSLSITVQLTGFVDPQRVMRRNNAKVGDFIYVTGSLGDAALALKLIASDNHVKKNILDSCMNKLNRPVPRVEFALAAAQYCSCAIDISDGLAADLGHILSSSQCGAKVFLENIPVSTELREYYSGNENGHMQIDWTTVLGGGDDYELCMIVSDEYSKAMASIAESMNLSLTHIGNVVAGNNLQIIDSEGQQYVLEKSGYGHFGDND